jgi:hypothetical protein
MTVVLEAPMSFSDGVVILVVLLLSVIGLALTALLMPIALIARLAWGRRTSRLT